MRIVQVVCTSAFAGVERHVARLSAALHDRGHEVTVLGGDPDQMREEIARAEVSVVAVASAVDAVRALRSLRSVTDVVATHMTQADIAGLLAVRGVPVVSTRHFAARRGSTALSRVLLAAASAGFAGQVAVSRYVAEHTEGPSTVIHPGLPQHEKRHPAMDRDAVVLVVQRLEREKETDVAVRAFAAAGLAAEGWRLEIAGDGAERAGLEHLAAELGIADATSFLGRRADVAALMDRAAVLLAPCSWEGFGLAVVEAMSVGLPVVAAAAGGHLESVGSVPGSVLFDPGDVDGAARLLSELAHDPLRRGEYGARLQESQRRHFSSAAQAEATEAAYVDALRSVRGGRERAPSHQGRALVLISLERWDKVWRRNQHLVAGLLRRDPALRVLFVEPAEDPLHAARAGRAPRPGRGLRQGPTLPGVDREALWLYQPTKVLPRRVDPRQDARWARRVRRAAARIGMTSPLLWVNDPLGAQVLRLTEWPTLYDITDDWLEADRDEATRGRLTRAEDHLLLAAHEVVVCSSALKRTKSRARPVTVVHNAVDVDAYQQPRSRPSDLPEGAVALYVGTLHGDRLDVELCADVATAVSPAHLVLVGPDALSPEERELLDRAGVARLGARRFDLVPAYLQHADVLLVPHVVDAFTDSLDPIKLYEYRAVGRPVVATPVAGFRESTSPQVMAVPRDEYAAAVVSALATSRPFPEGADPTVPSWADRVEEMATVINRVAASSGIAGGGTAPIRDVPRDVRIEMGHHVVQRVASWLGIRILHIKGLALDERLTHLGRTASDVDVLVEPERVEELVSALQGVGFELLGRFATSSPFEHSATLRHEHWGDLDVHRIFPGIGLPPDEAFEALWADRHQIELARSSCGVPSLAAQALVLVLHAARTPWSGQSRNDLNHVVHHLPTEVEEQMHRLVEELRAEVAFAAAAGDLEMHSQMQGHRLWRAVSQGGVGRVTEWRARIADASGTRARLRLLARAVTVNTDHLALLLGRRPTRREVVEEFVRRGSEGARELVSHGRRLT